MRDSQIKVGMRVQVKGTCSRYDGKVGVAKRKSACTGNWCIVFPGGVVGFYSPRQLKDSKES